MIIYPKHPDTDAYYIGGSFQPYAVVARDKRFTGAELAATYWMLSSRRERMLGYRDGANSESRKQAMLGLDQMATVMRFASLPHFDEVSA